MRFDRRAFGQVQTEATQPPDSAGGQAPASPSGSDWGDVPIYPSAGVLIESQTNPAVAVLCELAEMRAYSTLGTLKQVDSLHMDEMPKHGWKAGLHLCRDDICTSGWFKEAAKTRAFIEVGPGPEGNTAFKLTRSSGCSGSTD